MSTPTNAYSQNAGIAPVRQAISMPNAPGPTMINYPLGQIIVATSIGSSYILSALASFNGVVSATWDLLDVATGILATINSVAPVAGNFNMLGTAGQITVTPALGQDTFSIPAAFTAPGSIATTTTLAVGTNATVAGTLSVTGLLIGSTITGSTSVSAPIGSFTTLTSTTVNAVNLTVSGGAVVLGGTMQFNPTGGALNLIPQTVTSASAAATLNARVGIYTFTGFTTAAGAQQAFTLTNSTVFATSAVQVSVTNLNASTNGAFMGLQGVVQSAGSLIVHTINYGAAALGAGDNVLITVWVWN